MVHLVVLACVLRATTGKRSSTLFKKKVHPQKKNPGYAYNHIIVSATMSVSLST